MVWKMKEKNPLIKIQHLSPSTELLNTTRFQPLWKCNPLKQSHYDWMLERILSIQEAEHALSGTVGRTQKAQGTHGDDCGCWSVLLCCHQQECYTNLKGHGLSPLHKK